MERELPSPTTMTSVSGVLYVVDQSRSHIVGLDPITGRHLWSSGRRGSGPEELAIPVALLRAPTVGVVVLDAGTRRLTPLAPTGAFGTPRSIGAAAKQPVQGCQRDGEALLVSDAQAQEISRLDASGLDVSGQPNAAVPFPWPDLLDTSLWSRQILLRGDPTEGYCVAALISGRGFSVLPRSGTMHVFPYVEFFEVTGVGDRRREEESAFSAALDVELSGDMIYVLFAGRTDDFGRLIDVYDRKSGSYSHSYRLPFRTSEFALADSVFVLRLLSDSTAARLIALQPRR